MERFELPGSKACMGCGGLTFRNREDGLCPRCAFQAENLIEQIELDSLERDLTLMTKFDAYYSQRELARERESLSPAARTFGASRLFDERRYGERPFAQGPFWEKSA